MFCSDSLLRYCCPDLNAMTSWWKYFLAALTGWMLWTVCYWVAQFSAVPLKDNHTGEPCKKVGIRGLSWKMPVGRPCFSAGESFDFFHDYLMHFGKTWCATHSLDLSGNQYVSIKWTRRALVLWSAHASRLLLSFGFRLNQYSLAPSWNSDSFFWWLRSERHAADVCDVLFAVSRLLPVTIRFVQERPKHHHPHLADNV